MSFSKVLQNGRSMLSLDTVLTKEIVQVRLSFVTKAQNIIRVRIDGWVKREAIWQKQLHVVCDLLVCRLFLTRLAYSQILGVLSYHSNHTSAGDLDVALEPQDFTFIAFRALLGQHSQLDYLIPN
ncbi:hypothetical protein V7S43_002206 [Phytophthora oleae]|uniref:Uncharacterized protein n=1 Tax=Phytophthora oleae TaxID=2107226 RepID=A0ABD3G6Z6_9STRA